MSDFTFQFGEDKMDRSNLLGTVEVSEITCSICFDLFKRPMMLNNSNPFSSEEPCGHVFCHKCILEWLTRGNQCPSCRRVFNRDQLVPDKRMERQISGLKIKCNLSDCKWQGELGPDGIDFINHRIKCPSKFITCTYCKARVNKVTTSLGNHLLVCPEIKVNCTIGECKHSFVRKDSLKHASVCEYRPVPCQYLEYGCTIQVPFLKMSEHVNDYKDAHMIAMDEYIKILKQKPKRIDNSFITRWQIADNQEFYIRVDEYAWKFCINAERKTYSLVSLGQDVSATIIIQTSYYDMVIWNQEFKGGIEYAKRLDITFWPIVHCGKIIITNYYPIDLPKGKTTKRARTVPIVEITE